MLSNLNEPFYLDDTSMYTCKVLKEKTYWKRNEILYLSNIFAFTARSKLNWFDGHLECCNADQENRL